MRVIALLDRPSPKSFGMVGIVCDTRKNEELVVLGRGEKPVRASRREWVLYQSHLRNIESLGITLSDDTPNLVAGWLGEEFEETARAIGAPTPTQPQTCYQLRSEGSFWFEAPSDALGRLEMWTKRAAQKVFCDTVANAKAIADLMAYALPNAQETLAARWYTMTDGREKSREIEQQLQFFFRENNMTAETLVQMHRALIVRYQNLP